MSFISEFKQFAIKGNVMDMAVGVIIGAAFGKIVSSLVGDIIMPPLGLLIGNINFTDLQLTLRAAEGAQPAVYLRYGAFIQQVFDFTIVALAIFSVIKMMNKLKREEPPAPAAAPVVSGEEKVLREIRDLLAKKA